jgi:hypothetical protein
MTKRNPSAKLTGRALALILLLAALGFGALPAESQAAGSLDNYTSVPPEPGSDIPKAVVKFGMRPYADNTFYVIAMQKGWFKDVGIEFDPPPYGLKVTDTNVIALLLNGQLDMSSEYCPLLLPTYKSSKLLKCIAFTDNFLGEAILANPKLHLKSFKDYIAEGKSFDEAIHLAMLPLQGKTLVGAPELSDRPFEEAVSKFSKVQWNLQVLDDAKSLVLAKADREDFVNPEGAPIVYTLEQAGWVDLIDIGDLYKYGPAGLDSPIEPLVAIVGIGANANYVNAHQNTVLRFLSVVWRTIDAVQKDPSLFDLQAPYLNSVAGTSLDGKGVASTVNLLDPFTPFDQNKMYFDDPKNVLYYKNAWTAIIRDFAAHDIIPKDAVTPDQIIWAAPIWHQMVDYRNKTDRIMKDLEGKTLGAAKQALLARAKRYYEWYDFLDAYRLALAASG